MDSAHLESFNSSTTPMWQFWNNCKMSEVLTIMYYFERGFSFPLSICGFLLHIIAVTIVVRVQKKNPISTSHVIILLPLLIDDALLAFSNCWQFGLRKILYQAIHGDAVFMVDMKESFPVIRIISSDILLLLYLHSPFSQFKRSINNI